MKSLAWRLLPKKNVFFILLIGGAFLLIVSSPIGFQPSRGNFALSTANALLCGTHRCTLDDVTPECKTDATKCTEFDKQALRDISGCSPNSSLFGSFVGGPYSIGCSDTQIAQSAEAARIYESTTTTCI